jgi:2,3-dihydro-2,3-dihydroxybenzoate dehydrogenase
MVERLALQGKPVVAVDRSLRSTPAWPTLAVPMEADVTLREDVEGVVAEVEANLGPIDQLVNAAGILRLGEASTLGDSAWAEVFAVNATGVYVMTTAVLPAMITRRRGSVVTISSNAAHVPRIAMGAYCASKAAATMFTKCAALEVAQYGIRCNVVSPGSTDTAMLRTSWDNQDRRTATIAGDLEKFRLGIPLGRVAQPDDIVDAVEFLLSERARHITMADMTVDGGSTLGA